MWQDLTIPSELKLPAICQIVNKVLFSMLVCFSVCNFISYRMHFYWSHLRILLFKFFKTIVLRFKFLFYIKGTLMQIWKSPTVIVLKWKQYPNDFTSLILRIFKLFAREVCKFLKRVCFYLILIFCATFHIFHMWVSPNVKGVLMWNLRHTICMWRLRYWQILKSPLSFET